MLGRGRSGPREEDARGRNGCTRGARRYGHGVVGERCSGGGVIDPDTTAAGTGARTRPESGTMATLDIADDSTQGPSPGERAALLDRVGAYEPQRTTRS
ncbi:hypothetical protein QR77_04930 [Streptomyces sp. 150FB]|nr:hypothetical protein QR77_04930 [Streptomyces sp. 150FB]